jgi:hypothetical protein
MNSSNAVILSVTILFLYSFLDIDTYIDMIMQIVFIHATERDVRLQLQ